MINENRVSPKKFSLFSFLNSITMAKKKKDINYLETFLFPDIPDVIYPVYAISESGKVMNFKSIAYPNPRSKKRFTRNKQLGTRSMQAKIFDAIINIGYFNPLTVYREFPIIIDNHLRLPEQEGLYYYLDYYFPELRIAVELDSELHDLKKDKIRDLYLERLGIEVFRIDGLHKINVQKTIFPLLTKRLREKGVQPKISFDFLRSMREYKHKNLNSDNN